MKITSENYLVIQGWMITELNLKGNELLVYAVIYGFSQAEGQLFYGNRQYLADWTNTSKQTIQTCLNSLVKKKLLAKYDKDVNGVRFCEYEAKRDLNETNEISNTSGLMMEEVEEQKTPQLIYTKEKKQMDGGSQKSLPGVKKFDGASKSAQEDLKHVQNVQERTESVECTLGSQKSILVVKKFDGGSKKLTGVVKKIDGGSQKICPIDIKGITKNINNNINKQSINQSHLGSKSQGEMMNEIDAYRLLVKQNIDYDNLKEVLDLKNQEILDEIIELITDTIASTRDSIKIAQSEHSFEIVKSRLLKLNREHILYVLHCFSQNSNKIYNIRAYLLTSLYNAPDTIKSYYTALVKSDMLEGRV